MTRVSKQQERRHQSPRRPKAPQVKTGPKKDHLEKGYRQHQNALTGETASAKFIGKVK
ncbi:MAG: hypothetical protein JSR80_02535 [Verrucomicrobia bacterium]|nr:hypothetical protein [Verrucomicrobiota bacterium]